MSKSKKVVKFTKEWYLAEMGKKIRVGNRMVIVGIHRTESRGGSWERGFKFYSTQWGELTWTCSKTGRREYSLDGGKTWHRNIRDAMKSKGKVKLDSDSNGEFAFDAIQKINREYDPGFVWYR